jgi:hypothetical protein
MIVGLVYLRLYAVQESIQYWQEQQQVQKTIDQSTLASKINASVNQQVYYQADAVLPFALIKQLCKRERVK